MRACGRSLAPGANDPYKSLKTALRAEIDPEAWETPYRVESRPFARPSTGKIAAALARLSSADQKAPKTSAFDLRYLTGANLSHLVPCAFGLNGRYRP